MLISTAAPLPAVTIAKISAATQRAMARPEVQAKVDAWNSSRIGTPLPAEVRVRWHEKGLLGRGVTGEGARCHMRVVFVSCCMYVAYMHAPQLMRQWW